MSDDSNYEWWRAHGGSWKEEVDRRRQSMPIYHLQEILLDDYLRRCAPARVLEFGCGFGRHLAYLREVEGLEVFGFDQSESMVARIDWAPPEWRAEHVRTGTPLSPLPYPDRSFDVVFTVSVLIHVRPEHVVAVLKELARVARWQILHVETLARDASVLTSEAHEGCWAHDLAAAYRSIGLEAEELPRCFELEELTRVVVDPTRAVPDVRPGFAAKLLALDRSLSGEIERLTSSATRAAALEEQLAKTVGRLDEVRARVEELARREEELRERARRSEADLVERTREAKEQADALAARLEAARSRVAELSESDAAQRARARDAEAKLKDVMSQLGAQLAAQEAECARLRAHLEEQIVARTAAIASAESARRDAAARGAELEWLRERLRGLLRAETAAPRARDTGETTGA